MTWLDDEIKEIEYEQKKARNMNNRDFILLLIMVILLGVFSVNSAEACIPKKAQYEKEYWICGWCGYSNNYYDWDCWFCGNSRS